LRRQFWRSGSRAPQAQPFQRSIGKRTNTGKHSRGGRNGATKRTSKRNVLGVKLAARHNLRCFNSGLCAASCSYSTRNCSSAPGRRENKRGASYAGNIAATNARLDRVFFAINRRTQDVIPAFIAALSHVGILRADNLNAFFWRTSHKRRSHKGLRICASQKARGKVIWALVQFWHSGPIRQFLS
jgi:hypothetical protein